MNQKEIDELYAKSLGYDTFNYSDTRSRNEKEKYNVRVFLVLSDKLKVQNKKGAYN